MREKGDVNYDEYRYKKYAWHEGGRENLPQKKRVQKAPSAPAPMPEKQKGRKNRDGVKMDKQGAFVAITLLLCFSITFLLAISAGRGSALSIFGKKTTDDGEAYYCVSVGVYENESQAAAVAAELMQAGAAGYAVTDGGKYYLIAWAYRDETDATKVAERINGYATSVYKIAPPAPSLKWCKTSDKDAVEEALTYAAEAFDGLYDICVNLDKGNISESQARSRIQLLYNQIVKLTSVLDKITVSSDNFNLIKLRAEITACLAMLKNLTDGNTMRYNLSSEIKYTSIAVVVGYKNLTGNI